MMLLFVRNKNAMQQIFDEKSDESMKISETQVHEAHSSLFQSKESGRGGSEKYFTTSLANTHQTL